jgi:renalase
MKSVGIIGAGIAGLACAQRLRAAGVQVAIWEKSLGVGGRTATRHHASGCSFDHGAQYFTVREASFRQQVERWRAAGVVDVWQGRIVTWKEGRPQPLHDQPERYVGVPGMNALAKELAVGLNIQTRLAIETLQPSPRGWRVVGSGGEVHGPFDAVVSTVPAPQTAKLFQGSAGDFQPRLPAATMSPCWAVMLEPAEPIAVEFDAAFVHDSPLGWIARNSSKPQRGPRETWVLHATAEWSQSHLELGPESAAESLLRAFAIVVGKALPPSRSVVAHRWRYALPTQPLTERCLWDRRAGLGACGDWCGGPRVEGAFLSGEALAAAMLAEADRPVIQLEAIP